MQVEILCKQLPIPFSYPCLICVSLAYRAGVVSAVTAPDHDLFLSGLSVAFSLGDQDNPIIQDAAALHVSIRHFDGGLSVSAQMAALRGLLLNPPKGKWLQWSNRITSVCLSAAGHVITCANIARPLGWSTSCR